MNEHDIHAAAAMLLQHWRHSTRLAELPAHCRPETRAEGYAIQSELAKLSGQNVVGWKIAATSKAGQRHIRVDGPIAGCLLAARAREGGARIELAGSNMKVAEAEFAFRMGGDLPRRAQSYSVAEVMSAVATLHPAIEVPDSRYLDFTRVGAAQLIADLACACWFVIGAQTRVDWRAIDLAIHRVSAYRNGALAGQGSGANVLGDPRAALAWIANELCTYGEGLRAGDVVITGTCLTPVPVAAGDSVRMDFGEFGGLEIGFA
ncbi:MAG: fumarylacetoacetate hydrolase family protein [Burkholderiales bacterium]|nr:fumarylacetoacetate hydrolase family protein [Burkholderiales bacterium]